jgi:plasmid stabilization system protein ParE
MAQVIWTDPALSNLIFICDQLAAHSMAYAESIAERAFSQTDQLVLHPYLGQKMLPETEHNFRQLIIDRYIIVYQVNGSTVEILTIFDGRRDKAALLAKLRKIHLN